MVKSMVRSTNGLSRAPPISALALVSPGLFPNFCLTARTSLAKTVVIHVYSPFIVPGGTFEIRVLDAGCLQANVWDPSVSPPLVLETSMYGDVCASLPKNNYGEWGPANDETGMASDVLAVKEKFGNKPGMAKPRAEIGGARDNPVPDLKIDFTTDVLYCKEAFARRAYPFPPPPPEAWPCVNPPAPPWP